MCRMNDRFTSWGEFEAPDPGPQSFPRLAHAVPVETTLLAANLEAYFNLDSQLNALRLCHRFGRGALSRISQEILELIIDEAQRLERQQTLPRWEKRFACFHGRCTIGQHYKPYGPHTEQMWGIYFSDPFTCDVDEPLDPDDYTNDQKADMLEAEMDRDPYATDIESYWELHEANVAHWLELVCLCNKRQRPPGSPIALFQLNHMLKSRFGLEVYVLHEVLSRDMENFLPTVNCVDEYLHYSSAFLTLATGTFTGYSSKQPKTFYSNNLFVPDEKHLGFRQSIDPSALVLSENQRQRFARAMRILGLSPHFHLTEIESLIGQRTDNPTIAELDPALQDICMLQIPSWPRPSESPASEKLKKLEQFIERKSKELAKQSWPQLMLLAASDAVFPS